MWTILLVTALCLSLHVGSAHGGAGRVMLQANACSDSPGKNRPDVCSNTIPGIGGNQWDNNEIECHICSNPTYQLKCNLNFKFIQNNTVDCELDQGPLHTAISFSCPIQDCVINCDWAKVQGQVPGCAYQPIRDIFQLSAFLCSVLCPPETDFFLVQQVSRTTSLDGGSEPAQRQQRKGQGRASGGRQGKKGGRAAPQQESAAQQEHSEEQDPEAQQDELEKEQALCENAAKAGLSREQLKEQMEGLVDGPIAELGRKPGSTHNVLPCTAEQAVGRTILSWFVNDEGAEAGGLYEGRVLSYDAAKGEHTIVFGDGEVYQQVIPEEDCTVWNGHKWKGAGAYVTGRGAQWPASPALPEEQAAAAPAPAMEQPAEPTTATAAAAQSAPAAAAAPGADEALATAGSADMVTAASGELTTRRSFRGRKLAAQQLPSEELAESPRAPAAAAAAARPSDQPDSAPASGAPLEAVPAEPLAEVPAQVVGQPSAAPVAVPLITAAAGAPEQQQLQGGEQAQRGVHAQQAQQGSQPAEAPHAGPETHSVGVVVTVQPAHSDAATPADELALPVAQPHLAEQSKREPAGQPGSAQVAQQAQHTSQGGKQAPAPAELVDLSGLQGAEEADAMDVDIMNASPAPTPAAAPAQLAPAAGSAGAEQRDSLSVEPAMQQQQQQQQAVRPEAADGAQRRLSVAGSGADEIDAVIVNTAIPLAAGGAVPAQGLLIAPKVVLTGKPGRAKRHPKEKGAAGAKQQRGAAVKGAARAAPGTVLSPPAPPSATKAATTPRALQQQRKQQQQQQHAERPRDEMEELRQLQQELERHTHQVASAQGQAAAGARAIKSILDALRSRGVTVEQLQATQRAAVQAGGKGGLGRAVAQVGKDAKKLGAPVAEVVADAMLAGALSPPGQAALGDTRKGLQEVDEAADSSRALVEEWKAMTNAPAPPPQHAQQAERGQRQPKRPRPSPGGATTPGVALQLFTSAGQSGELAAAAATAAAGTAELAPAGRGNLGGAAEPAMKQEGDAGEGGHGARLEPRASAEEDLFESTGNRDRDHAILVLAAALAEGRPAFLAAVELEQALFERHPPAAGQQPAPENGRQGAYDTQCSSAYLRELKTLWEVVSPQAPGFRPLLRYLLLSGGLLPSELVVAPPERIQQAEAAFLARARQQHEGGDSSGAGGAAAGVVRGGINRALARLPPAAVPAHAAVKHEPHSTQLPHQGQQTGAPPPPPPPEQQQQQAGGSSRAAGLPAAAAPAPPATLAGASLAPASRLSARTAPALDPVAAAQAAAAKITAERLAEVGGAIGGSGSMGSLTQPPAMPPAPARLAAPPADRQPPGVAPWAAGSQAAQPLPPPPIAPSFGGPPAPPYAGMGQGPPPPPVAPWVQGAPPPPPVGSFPPAPYGLTPPGPQPPPHASFEMGLPPPPFFPPPPASTPPAAAAAGAAVPPPPPLPPAPPAAPPQQSD
ncbi:hypothetical protein N2152v2_001417 [Parachlorella kessleri]